MDPIWNSTGAKWAGGDQVKLTKRKKGEGQNRTKNTRKENFSEKD